jgi:hypothetical protein
VEVTASTGDYVEDGFQRNRTTLGIRGCRRRGGIARALRLWIFELVSLAEMRMPWRVGVAEAVMFLMVDIGEMGISRRRSDREIPRCYRQYILYLIRNSGWRFCCRQPKRSGVP